MLLNGIYGVYILYLFFLTVTDCSINSYVMATDESQNQKHLFVLKNVTVCLEKLKNIRKNALDIKDCCLTTTCAYERILVSHEFKTKEILQLLCNEKLYQRELSAGCTWKNISSKSIKLINKNKEPFVVIAKSANKFKVNGASAQINPKPVEESPVSTTAMSVSLKQDKMKEPTNDSLTHRTAKNSGLQFLDIPRGDDLKIQELQLEDEYLLFEAFSSLMGYLLPRKVPADVLRDALRNQVPFHIWVVQVIKLEILVVVWIIFWAMLSLCLPMGVMASFCFPTNIRRLNEEFSNDSLDNAERWTENTLGCLLHILLLLLLCPVILILAGNEQISRSISKAPDSTTIIYGDINTFIRNSHMQISFVATSSTDITIEAIRKDLEEIETLLGTPYQQELARETGIDLALVALEKLKEDTAKVTSIVSDLLIECEAARKAANVLQGELQEVARQLVEIQQQCGAKDRTLCFTLQFSSFDVTLPVNNLTHDVKIQQLDRMNKEDNFNASIQMARKSFAAIPDQVALETAQYILDIRTVLSRKRTEVYKSTHDLDVLARNLSQEVSASQETISTVIANLVKWDLWRWLTILGISSIIALTWGLLICGAPCGCGVTSKTVTLLISGIGLSCILCIIVWALGTISLLIGGHGQSLVCQPLYDHPHYETLSEFVDPGGIFYGNKGFFNSIRGRNNSINVANLIKGCQRDQPVYKTFHLHHQIDLEKNFNHRKWIDLKSLFENFTVAKSNTEILSPGLQLSLQILSSNSATNLTNHRLQMSGPVTHRDLGSFADQLNTVGRQLTDPVISRKVGNLAFSIRKVVHNEMQRLNEIRGRILYKITTLEVLLPPLNRQVNQSLSHLKTIQFFLDNQGWQIVERTRKQFIARIENYLDDLYNHAFNKVSNEIGKCRPLWEIFHATRFSVCKLVVAPTNAIAFASFFLILLFIATTPVVIKLIDFYKESQDEDFFTSISHRHARDGLVIDDEGTWASPSIESPEEHTGSVIPTTWVSPPPRPPTVSSRIQISRVPQISAIRPAGLSRPKSKLSSLASRITGARNLQIPSVSMARTPRRGHESLRLIEPIHWKSGSTTPGSWI